MTLMPASDAPGRDWVNWYFERNFRLVFYPSGQKGPVETNWQTHTYSAADYREGMNVGLLLGHELAEARYLLDVDFDWREGLVLAQHILPTNTLGCGRQSNPIGHAFYTTSAPVASRRFLRVEGKKPYVELRGSKKDGGLGFQTMVTPSLHPDNERIEHRGHHEVLHDDSVPRLVTLYAIGCILLDHLGQRAFLHDLRMALPGFLLKLRVKKEEVVRLVQALAHATGNDVHDAERCVHDTATKLQERGKRAVTGAGVLADAIGPDGPQVVKRITSWLDADSAEHSDFVMARGQPVPDNQDNVRRALAKLGVKVTFDIFRQKAQVSYSGFDEHGYEGGLEDAVRDRIWFHVDREFGFRPPSEYFDKVLLDTAHQHKVHPVREYLGALTWDGQPRLDTWLTRYGGATDTEYTRVVGAIVLMAAVRRVRQPGCKFDELLVLESSQGKLKSSALKALCPDPTWFSDDLPLGVDAKQIIERTAGKWIIEAAELSGMRSSQMEHLKAMLSRQVDGPVRMAYDRLPKEQPRQFIVVGTTNSHTYLGDSTGNRRFWPVRVETFEIDALKRDRDQLWGEAAKREAEGRSIRLPEELYKHAGLQQERRRIDDPWEETLAHAFAAKDERVTPDELWTVLGITTDRQDERAQRRVSQILQRLEFRRMTVRDAGGNPRWGWGRGDVRRTQARLKDVDAGNDEPGGM